MSNGWAFALGWIGCSMFIAWGFNGPVPLIASLVRLLTKRPRSLRRWKIGDTVYRPRRLTRAVMESVMQVQTHSVDVPLPVLLMMGGERPDDDEYRQRQMQMHAARTAAMYETASLLVEDSAGQSPAVRLLEDELTVDQVNEIVQVCM